MFLLYFYVALSVLLLVYMLVERERLLFYKEINQIKDEQAYVAKMPISIQTFSRYARAAIIPSVNKGKSILFEYRRLIYIAIPLGDHDVLISRMHESHA